MFTQLPYEMIREIFSFSGKWWLKRNTELVNIEKLYQIKRPMPQYFSSATVNYHILLPITITSSYELRSTYWRRGRYFSFHIMHNTNPIRHPSGVGYVDMYTSHTYERVHRYLKNGKKWVKINGDEEEEMSVFN